MAIITQSEAQIGLQIQSNCWHRIAEQTIETLETHIN